MSWRSFKLPSLFNSTIESIKIKMYQSNWIGFGFSPSESILFSLFKVCPESGLEWKMWSVFSSYKHVATKPENSQKKEYTSNLLAWELICDKIGVSSNCLVSSSGWLAISNWTHLKKRWKFAIQMKMFVWSIQLAFGLVIWSEITS